MTRIEYKVDRHAETGPLLGSGPAPEPPRVPRGRPSDANRSNSGRPPTSRADRLTKQWGPQTSERLALLGILLARLEGVPFEDVGELLGVKPPRLERMMRGEDQIPGSVVDRWQLVAEMLDNLHSVLKPRATGRWLRTNIPDLGGRTPLEVAASGGLPRVRDLTARYRDPSFS
jgi:hypothetical protein